MDNNQGKRMAQGMVLSQGKKTAIIVVAILLAFCVGGYLGLCAYVANGVTVLPNTTAAGVDLSGLTQAQAEARLTETITARHKKQVVTLSYGADGRLLVRGSDLRLDAGTAAARAALVGRQNGFLNGGAALVAGLFGGHRVEVPLHFPEGAAPFAALAAQVDRPVVETTWEITDTAIELVKGQTGLRIDQAALEERVLTLFEEGNAQELLEGGALPDALFHGEPEMVSPAPVDFEAIYRQVHTLPKDAALDPETYEISPSVIGVSFDVEQAGALLDATAAGGACTVPLDLEYPAMTTEQLEAILFHDLLGEATSEVGGTQNRRSNVRLSAEACNGKIFMPGGVFSYNNTTGSRTADAGYLPAPAYVGGRSEDEIGGGICQTSSTIYYAALNSNLKIVERHSHSYAVGYVPDGMDATVWFGSLDFRFENDTEHPIKIVTRSYDKGGKRYLNVKIYSTKLDDTYVEMTNERYDFVSWETVYKPDETVPVGTTKVDVTPYTGRKANAYRNVYDGEGSLVS
ncbi:MAG: VanW family protein, partial [Clostridiales bacterium]|nr:VanW family protein [Clostridiales bacterium]